ncbi:MAG: DEAD/DEAH box helicase [Acholeplasmatales bacterium]|nr:DEAD/DEAH box helicase [Acholeplasmatales bacterium]
MSNFRDFKISNAIIEALEEDNIFEPTPIQEGSIPLFLEGYDLIGQAQTGTGKTFAYSIPLIERLNKNSKNVEALILCPTRELSIQVSNEINKLINNDKKIKTATIYGGESYEKQFKELRLNPQIVIGTPGRIIDMMEKKKLSFKNIKTLILDEADEMLKMGFQEDLEKILSEMPEDRQTGLFSATMPAFIKNITKKYMHEPKVVKIEAKTLTVEAIDEKVYFCKRDSKKDLLIRLLDYNQFKCVMIFANTKAMVDELVLFLQKEGFRCDGIHGDLKQNMRDRVMQSFRTSNVDILVATDVAARGIDIDGIDCVINFDVPNENELYVHRIGRTARAGMTGTAITIATSHSKGRISDIENYTKRKIKREEIPSIKDINTTLNKKLYLTILDNVEKYKDIHDYDALISKLARINSDPVPVLNALLKMIDFNKREYKEIKIMRYNDNKDKNKKDKDKKSKSSDNNKKDSKEKSFVIIETNIGEDDKVRPNQLVNFFHDEYMIHREHFGKIVITKNKTYFEVKKEALRFFSQSKKKFNNKKLTFKEINTLPKKKG